MTEIRVSEHAVERFKTRVFRKDLIEDEKIIKFLETGARKGEYVRNAADGAVEMRYNGVYFILKNNVILTVNGDKKYRAWAKKESQPRFVLSRIVI